MKTCREIILDFDLSLIPPMLTNCEDGIDVEGLTLDILESLKVDPDKMDDGDFLTSIEDLLDRLEADDGNGVKWIVDRDDFRVHETTAMGV